MSGWCPPFSVCGMAVACAAVLPSAVVRLVPYSSHCSTRQHCSTCRALFFARCVVCGWWVRVCAVRVVGYPLCALPLVVVVGGAIVDGGVPLWMVGGMVSEGRLCAGLPVLCVVSPFPFAWWSR